MIYYMFICVLLSWIWTVVVDNAFSGRLSTVLS